MTLVILLALGVGVGLTGVITGLRSQKTSLQSLFSGLGVESSTAGRHEPLPWQRDTKRIDHQVVMRVACDPRTWIFRNASWALDSVLFYLTRSTRSSMCG